MITAASPVRSAISDSMSIINVFCRFFSFFCSLLLPLGAAGYICAKKRRCIKPLLTGAATFLLFQLLTRLPLLQLVLPKMPWFILMQLKQPLLYLLFLGFTAGLFEEAGRYIMMRLFMRKEPGAGSALAFGLGHGGLEAVLLVGINSAVLLFMPDLADAPLMLAGGLERLSAMCLHCCWSVLIARGIREKRPLALPLAIAAHTLIDTLAAYAAVMGVNIWITELGLLLCAVPAVLFIKKELKKEICS